MLGNVLRLQKAAPRVRQIPTRLISRKYHVSSPQRADIFDSIVIDEKEKLRVEDLARTRGTARKTKLSTSRQKLKEVCRQIRGMKVTEALRQLTVNKRQVANELRKTVLMAANNAKNLNIPQENLVVSHLIIGRQTPLKRLNIHARGRIGRKEHPKTMITVHVEPMSVLPGRKWEYRRQKLLVKERFDNWRKGTLPPPAQKVAQTVNE